MAASGDRAAGADLRCRRCGRLEKIPPSQGIKFEDVERPLCRPCHEGFRRWLMKPERS